MALRIRAPFQDILNTSGFLRITFQTRRGIALKTQTKSLHWQHSHKQIWRLGDRHEQVAGETYQWIQLQVPLPRLPWNPLEPLPLPCGRRGLHRRHLSRHSTTKPVSQVHESTGAHGRSQHYPASIKSTEEKIHTGVRGALASQAQDLASATQIRARAGAWPRNDGGSASPPHSHPLHQTEGVWGGEKARMRRLPPPPPPLIGHCFRSPPPAPLLCSAPPRSRGFGGVGVKGRKQVVLGVFLVEKG
jgi:hypothetical protein